MASDSEEEIIETLFDKATYENDRQSWEEKLCSDLGGCGEILGSTDQADDLRCECDARCDDDTSHSCHESYQSTDSVTFGGVGGISDFVDHAVSDAGGDDDEDDDDTKGEFSYALLGMVCYGGIDESDDDRDGQSMHTTEKIRQSVGCV